MRFMLQRSIHRFMLGVVTLLGLTIEPASGQNPSLSTSMLRRIAEAIDGFDSPNPQWVVVNRTPPRVLGVFPSRQLAMAARQQGTDVFGPYTPSVARGDSLILVCIHTSRPIYSTYVCPKGPDSLRSVTVTAIQNGRAAGSSVMIRYISSNAPPRDTIINGAVDLITFTMDGFDQFIAPRYSKIFGPRATTRLRDSLRLGVRTP